MIADIIILLISKSLFKFAWRKREMGRGIFQAKEVIKPTDKESNVMESYAIWGRGVDVRIRASSGTWSGPPTPNPILEYLWE